MAFFLNDQSDTVLFRIFLGLLCKGIAGCDYPRDNGICGMPLSNSLCLVEYKHISGKIQ